MRRLGWSAGVLIGACLLGACASGETAASKADVPVVHRADTSLGEVLVDPDGHTLYLSLDDTGGESACYGACAATWLPVDGELALSPDLWPLGFDAVARTDGRAQLRIAKRWPLYTSVADVAPGAVNGHKIDNTWYALGAGGVPIDVDGDRPGAAATSTPEPPTTTTPPSAAGTAATDIGPVLADDEGYTLYMFFRDTPAGDTPAASNCTEPCSTTWPPAGPDSARGVLGLGIDADTVTRPDGRAQLTVSGWPLYRYIDDGAPGEVDGQGVGQVWYAMDPAGVIIIPPAVRIGSTDAGSVLVDPAGHTLYQITADGHDVSTCNDRCSRIWIPVPGPTPVDRAVDGSQFGQIARDDGTTQLAFRGHALYTYVGDTNPGDANGALIGDPGTHAPIDASRVTVSG